MQADEAEAVVPEHTTLHRSVATPEVALAAEEPTPAPTPAPRLSGLERIGNKLTAQRARDEALNTAVDIAGDLADDTVKYNVLEQSAESSDLASDGTFWAMVMIYLFVWLLLFIIAYMRAANQYNYEKYVEAEDLEYVCTCGKIRCECGTGESTSATAAEGHERRVRWRDLAEIRNSEKYVHLPVMTRSDKFFVGSTVLDTRCIRFCSSCCGRYQCRPCSICELCNVKSQSWENQKTAFIWLWLGTSPFIFFITIIMELIFMFTVNPCIRTSVEDQENESVVREVRSNSNLSNKIPKGLRDQGPKTHFPFARGDLLIRNKLAEIYQWEVQKAKLDERLGPDVTPEAAGILRGNNTPREVNQKWFKRAAEDTNKDIPTGTSSGLAQSTEEEEKKQDKESAMAAALVEQDIAQQREAQQRREAAERNAAEKDEAELSLLKAIEDEETELMGTV
jgi:hypothetical protein